MMNKCAKFHKDSPSGKKVKFNLARAIELSRFCVQLCIETLCKRATSVAHLTNFSFDLFYEILTEDASLPILYHGTKKSKMTKNPNQGGGSCLNLIHFFDGKNNIAGLAVINRPDNLVPALKQALFLLLSTL